MPFPLLRDPAALRRAAAVTGGVAALSALAGCTASPAATSSPATASSAAASSGSSADAGAGQYADGTYSASGTYQSPGGLSKVGVRVTLKGGTITAVEVEPEAENATARQYEQQFASGIGAVAVGKPIDALTVGAVSGSSLTAAGFEKALAQIRSDAAA